jgi:hypothetical protein
MPSSTIDSVIRAFKAKFQAEQGAYIPMALRQESSDVVFVSLLEEDRPPFEMPGPMAGYEVDAPQMPMGQDPEMMLEELLGASMEGAEGGGPQMPMEALLGDPMAPGGGSEGGQPDLASMLGMM